MKSVTDEISTNYREKGSKFIGVLFPAVSIAAFDEKYDQIKEEYRDATHHCYAWRINPNDEKRFAQDDGEPSGSAGLPILNQLKSFETINLACMVIRYFGGTQLGKSGLIRAYGYTAKQCLQKARLKKLVRTRKFTITYPYSQQTQIDQLKNRFDLKQTDASYLENVTIEIDCRLEQAPAFGKKLNRLQHLGIEAEKRHKSFVTFSS